MIKLQERRKVDEQIIRWKSGPPRSRNADSKYSPACASVRISNITCYFNTLRTGSFKLFKRQLPGFLNNFNPLNAELNPICYLLALLAQNFLHVSSIRVKSLTIRRLMPYIYIYIYIYDISSLRVKREKENNSPQSRSVRATKYCALRILHIYDLSYKQLQIHVTHIYDYTVTQLRSSTFQLYRFLIFLK